MRFFSEILTDMLKANRNKVVQLEISYQIMSKILVQEHD